MNGIKTARGGLACCVTSKETDGDTVGIPSLSISRWTNAIDWWQIGQAGAAITASGFSSAIAAAKSFAKVFCNLWGSMLYPMNV